jgi:hypothetical protein
VPAGVRDVRSCAREPSSASPSSVRNQRARCGVQHVMRRTVLVVLAVCAMSACGATNVGTSAETPTPSSSRTSLVPTTPIPPGDSAPIDAAQTDTSTVDGSGDAVAVTDVLPAGAWTGARTSPDGLTLVLFFVGFAEYVPAQPCSMRYEPVVEETDGEVRISIRGEHPPTADTSMVCPLAGYARSAEVRLAAPLAGRTLVGLGQARGVFDGSTLAEPAWLPDGWVQTSEHPGLVEPDVAWTRAWTPALPKGDGAVCPQGPSGLALHEGPAEVIARSLGPVEQQNTGTHDINGATATASIQTNRNITRLTWAVGDRTYLLSSAPACDGDQPPSLDIMLQFARSLNTPPHPSDGAVELPCVDVPIGVPTQCPIGTHCGVTMFGTNVNGQWWKTDEGADVVDYIPSAWGTYMAPPSEVSVVVADGPDPTLTASLNGHSVTYRPVPESEVDWCA